MLYLASYINIYLTPLTDDDIYIERTKDRVADSAIRRLYELEKNLVTIRYCQFADITNYTDELRIDISQPMSVLKQLLSEVCDKVGLCSSVCRICVHVC